MQFFIREISEGNFVELTPFAQIESADAVHPWQIVELWSDAELSAIDVYRVSADVPEGEQYVSHSFARVEGVVTALLVTEPIPDPFGTIPPQLVASALNVVIADGDVAAVNGAFNIIGMTYDDVGLYTIYLLSEQTNISYFALASGVTLREVDKQLDYLTVEALDATGTRFDPATFGVNLYRI